MISQKEGKGKGRKKEDALGPNEERKKERGRLASLLAGQKGKDSHRGKTEYLLEKKKGSAPKQKTSSV